MCGSAFEWTISAVLLLIFSRTHVYGVEKFEYQNTKRCGFSTETPGTNFPSGGTPIIQDPDKTTQDTVEKCAKHCVDNLFQFEINCLTQPGSAGCVVDCQYAVFQKATKECLLYPATTNLANQLKGEKVLITIKDTGCPPATTTAASAAKATTAAAAKATTKKAAAAVTAAAATTKAAAAITTAKPSGTAGDTNAGCCEWAKKGECDINPFYMKVQCKGSCGTPTATTANANTVASNPIATCKPTTTANAACKDKSPDCTKWALDGQCDKNPYYMRVNCATACRQCATGATPKTFKNACGDTDVPAIAGCANSKDDCNFWTSIGECTRNAAWMSTNCCAACRNKKVIFQTCPLAGKAKFTGVG